MWVKIQPNMIALTKMAKRQNFWIFILHCLMKYGGVDRMFPFAKRGITKYETKNNWPGGLIKFVGNSCVYQAPESNCFIAGCATGVHKTLFSPPVCSMFNETAQY